MPERKEINLLIVDDDYVTRIIHRKVAESFEEFQFNIDEASNGIEALQILSGKDFIDRKIHYLILLDCNMPIMNGFDFIENFRRLDISNHIDIIVVTSSDNVNDRIKSESLGIKYHLLKPLTIEMLKSVIIHTIKNY
jgi:CheY-like chemotaxis protein